MTAKAGITCPQFHNHGGCPSETACTAEASDAMAAVESSGGRGSQGWGYGGAWSPCRGRSNRGYGWGGGLIPDRRGGLGGAAEGGHLRRRKWLVEGVEEERKQREIDREIRGACWWLQPWLREEEGWTEKPNPNSIEDWRFRFWFGFVANEIKMSVVCRWDAVNWWFAYKS